jgi:hypothetical protein
MVVPLTLEIKPYRPLRKATLLEKRGEGRDEI